MSVAVLVLYTFHTYWKCLGPKAFFIKKLVKIYFKLYSVEHCSVGKKNKRRKEKKKTLASHFPFLLGERIHILNAMQHKILR